MANSVKPGPHGSHHHHHRNHRHAAVVPPKTPVPPVTPGIKGRGDAADPTFTTLLGFTNGLTGVRDRADHTLHENPAHIKAFLKFAKTNKTLLSGLRNKNYEQIAEGYNGAEWRNLNPEYASNIEKFSKDWK